MSHTTTFLFRSDDYFTALTDRDEVRIGFIGGTCFNTPRGHAYYDRICEASTAAEVESYHDELMSAYS